LAVCLVGLFVGGLRARTVDRYARVTTVQGSAQMLARGQLSRLAAGAVIDGRQPVTLRTGPKSSLVLHVRGGSIKLGERAALTIQELGYHRGSQRAFALARGAAWVRVGPLRRRHSRFAIRHSDVTVDARDARLALEAHRNTLLVNALDGTVHVGSGGVDRRLRPGQAVAVAGGAETPEPKALGADELVQLRKGFGFTDRVTLPVRADDALADAGDGVANLGEALVGLIRPKG
jgi:hypothetical protein